jgi:hypothetical protein
MLLLVDAKIFALLSKTKIFRFLLQVDENGPHCHTSDPTKQQPTIVQQSNGSGGIRQLFPPEWLRVVSGGYSHVFLFPPPAKSTVFRRNSYIRHGASP